MSGIVQTGGSLAVLVTISYLAHTAGPVAQGLFSSLKAEFDFFSVFLLMGLPQALFYFVVSKEFDSERALALAIVHALISLLVIVCWMAVNYYHTHATYSSVVYAALFAPAVAVGIFYANARAIVLAERSAITFSVVTTLPSVFVLVVVLIGVAYLANTNSNVSSIASPLVFAIAYGLAMIVTVSLVRRSRNLGFTDLSIKGVGKLFRFGIATWMPGIAQAASNLFAIRWIGDQLSLAEGLGGFSTAFALVMAILAPLTMVIPLFFKWWTPIATERRNSELATTLGAVLVLSCICIAMVWLLEEQLVRIMFGDEYLVFIGIYAAMSTTVIPQAVFRMWGVYCSSSGRPSGAAWLEFFRLVVVIWSIYCFGTDLKSTVYALIFAEYCSLLLGALLIMIIRRSSLASSV